MKILGIGLSRTGTRSLAEALAVLGFNAAHFILPREFGKFEAITDITVSVRYKELDLMYPGSKFILTLRDIEGWLKSYRKHLSRTNLDIYDIEWLREIWYCRTRLYGGMDFNHERCRDAYISYVSDVGEYFKDRSTDILELNIFEMGDKQKWESLCRFLDTPVPSRPFPALNGSIPSLSSGCLLAHSWHGSRSKMGKWV